MANEVGVAYVALMPSMDKFNKAVRQAIKDNMGQFSSAVDNAGGDAIGGLEKAAKKLADNGGNYGKEAGSSLGNSFMDAFSKALGDPSAALSAIMSPLVAGLSSAFSGGMNRIRTAFAVNIPWVTAGAQAGAQVATGINAAMPAVAKAGADIGKTLGESIGKSGAPKVTDSIKDAISDIDAKVSKVSSNISKAAKNSVDNVKEAINGVNTSLKALAPAKEAVAALPESRQKLLDMTKAIVPASDAWRSYFSTMSDALGGMRKEIPLTDYTVEIIDDVADSVALLPSEIDDVSRSLIKLPDASKLANIGSLGNITAGFADAGGKSASGFVSRFKQGFSAAGGWKAIGIAAGVAIVAGLVAAVGKLFKVSAQLVKVGAQMAAAVVKAFANAAAKICEYIVSGVKQAYSQVGKLMLNLGKAEVGTAAKSLGINLGNGVADGLSSAKIMVGNIVSGMISSAIGAVTSSVSSAIGRVDTMNNFPKIMANMGIGAEESEKAIKQLSEAIDGLPTSLDEAALGTQRLVAKNGDLAKSTDYFTALNNAILAGGASSQIQSSAIEQLTQSYSKGKMDMMEWRSLQMAMPAQLNQIAAAMGKSADELGEGLRKGDISMDEFMDTLVKLNKEGGDGFASFAEQAKTSSKTIGTAITNVQNRVNKAMASVIEWVGQENIFDAIESVSSKFGPFANSLTEFLDKIEAKRYIGEMMGAVGDAFGKITEKAAPLKTALAPIIEGALPKALEVTKSTLDTIIDRAEPFINKVADFVSEVPNMAGDIQPIIDALINGKFDTWEAALAMWEKVVKAVAPVMPQIIQAQTQVNTTLAETIGNLAGTVAPIVADLATTVSDMIATAGPFVERLVTALAPVFTTIYTQIEGIYNKVIEAASQGTIIEDSAASLDHIMATVGETVGNILAALVPHIPTILDMADRIVTALAPAVQRIFDALEPYIDPLLDLFADAAEKLAPAIAECFEILAPHIPDLMDFVSNVIDLIANNLPGVAGIVGDILDVCLPIFNDIIDIADNVLPVIIDLVGILTDALKWLYDNILSPIFDLVKDITDFLKDPSWDKFAGQFTNNTSVPSTRPFATGGIVTKPTRALIGEAGVPEAVVPLSAQGVQKFTSGLAPQYAAGGPSVEVHIDTFMNYDTDRDVRSLSEAIGKDTLRQLKMQGVYA